MITFLKWQNYYKDEEQIHDGKETELRNDYDYKKELHKEFSL